jgi:hypothetical protein
VNLRTLTERHVITFPKPNHGQLLFNTCIKHGQLLFNICTNHGQLLLNTCIKDFSGNPLSELTHIDGEACNNIPEAGNKLALSAC